MRRYVAPAEPHFKPQKHGKLTQMGFRTQTLNNKALWRRTTTRTVQYSMTRRRRVIYDSLTADRFSTVVTVLQYGDFVVVFIRVMYSTVQWYD